MALEAPKTDLERTVVAWWEDQLLSEIWRLRAQRPPAIALGWGHIQNLNQAMYIGAKWLDCR